MKFPQTGFSLAELIFKESLIWGVTFTLAFYVSGITATQLCLKISRPLRALAYGFLWFLVIRILSVAILVPQLKWIHQPWVAKQEMLSSMKADHLIEHPIFSFFTFGTIALLAGFSEELWRVGMLRGLGGVFPQFKGVKAAIYINIVVVSLLFGAGHLYEGWDGAENAVLVGLFFGAIVAYRRSYWEVAIAHTLFDAMSFAALTFFLLHPNFLAPKLVGGAFRGDIAEIDFLIKKGVDVNEGSGSRKMTALEVAATRPNPDVVRFLLDKGANPNKGDKYGETPLMGASEAAEVENIKLLASRGANLNQTNDLGFTALRWAIQHNHVEAARLLINLGADVNLADKQGLTPLAAAKDKGYDALVSLLEQNGGK